MSSISLHGGHTPFFYCEDSKDKMPDSLSVSAPQDAVGSQLSISRPKVKKKTGIPLHVRKFVHSGAICKANQKQLPYFSYRHVKSIENHNGKVSFACSDKATLDNKDRAILTDDPILCRHLATKYATSRREYPSQKIFVHEQFGSHEAIQENVRPSIELEFENIKRDACARHIIDTMKFGQFLAGQAKDLASGQKKWYLLTSSCHAMAFELHYKTTEDENGSVRNRYVVRLFDPNKTNVIARCEVENIDAFDSEKYCLSKFLGVDCYWLYFQNKPAYPPEQECTVYDCSNPAKPNPKFTTLQTASEHGVSSIMLFTLLVDGGDPDAICKIADHPGFRDLSGEKLEKVLMALNNDGRSGLFKALVIGQAKAISAFATLLKNVPLESRLKILSQASFWGISGHSGRYEALLSGLREAIRGGHAEAVTAYGALLEGIPPGFLPALLNAKSLFVDSDIYRAIWDGHIEAVEAYANLLDKFLPEQRHSTLIRMAINFISASHKACEYCATAVNMVRTGPQKLNSYTEYYLNKYGSAISDILGEQEFVLGG